MASQEKKYSDTERRNGERRHGEDRRRAIRFGDILGRRSGIERRVGWRPPA